MLFLGWVITSLFIFSSHPQRYNSHEYIFELTDQNFNEKIKSFQQTLVIFYKNHEDLLKFLKAEPENHYGIENEDPVYLVYLDCNDFGKNVCAKYGVTENVEVKIFEEGIHKIDYTGPLSKNLAVKYLRNLNKPNYVELKNQKDIENFMLNQENMFILGYFTSNTNLRNAFLDVANDLKHIYNFALITKFDYSNRDKIVLQKPLHLQNKFEPASVTYQGKSNKKDITNFIEKNKHGLVVLSNDYSTIIYPLAIVYFDVDLKNPQILNYCRNRVLQVAYKFINKTNFAISPRIDFKKNVTYPHVILKVSESKIFEMVEKFTSENLEQFLNNILSNALVKSEEVPKDNGDILVTTVAKNFIEVVLKSPKNVFLILYNSKQNIDSDLFTSCEDAATIFQDELIVTKMDVSKNQILGPFEFYTNPTMFWISKNKNSKPELYNPEMFSSGRFIKFVENKILSKYNKDEV
ncbi:unnamed protein product [Brassicogethes aeneus]|uniref:protein disulfide-isomerase n=1 Tax=Brassicogethes aeneus TaxID=1431903 RepID=A0A9P0BCS7_BRAAE|nr:unnamed protein product [Brassicogethes aeneus]